MNQTLVKVGIIGVGKMGALHLEKFLSLPEVSAAGIFETNDATAASICDRYGVRRFENLAELLFEADAVVIATPTPAHYSIAKQALEAGDHVLIEKPVAETRTQIEELIEISQRNALVFQPAFVERFRFVQLCQGVEMYPPKFVETHRLTPSLGRDSSVDVLSDLMIHDLDLLLSLIPEEPSLVSAVGVSVITDKCDLANVRLEFPGGAVANLNASRVSKNVFRKFRIFSDHQYVSLDFVDNSVERVSRDGESKIKSAHHSAEGLDPLLTQAAAFVKSIVTGTPPVVSALAGCRAIGLIEKIRGIIAQRGRLTAAITDSTSSLVI